MDRFKYIRTRRSLRAFSITELMAVATILLILSSIAVASFFMFRDAGEDSISQSTLSTLEITQRFYYRDHGVFLTDSLDLRELEVATYSFVADDEESTSPTQVSVLTGTTLGSDWVYMVSASNSETCYALKIYESGGGAPESISYERVDGSVLCEAAQSTGALVTSTWGLD